MRPDTRSFSFTWLRGHQHEQELSMGRPATRSQTARRHLDMDQGIMEEEMTETNDDGHQSGRVSPVGRDHQRLENDREVQPSQGCSTGKMNLKRFGSSFLKNMTNNMGMKYSNMEVDEQQTKIQTKKSKDKDTKKKAETLCKIAVKETGVDDEDLMNEIPVNFKTNSLSIGRKINKTVQDVKSSLENFSQRFRRSTRKRYRMSAVESPMSPTRKILGRTPTKLYSPFGFDSPIRKTPKRLGTRPSTPRLAKSKKPDLLGDLHSPGNSFRNDLKDVHRGLHDLGLATRGITRRSVRF